MALLRNPSPDDMIEVDAGIYYEGETLKAGTAESRAAKTTTKGDRCIGIVCQTRTDPRTATAEAYAAGDKMNYYKLGSGARVDVKMIISQALTPGCDIYLDNSVNGQATISASTSRPIGHYPRNMAARTTAVAGELVPMDLDVEEGAALV